MRHRRCKTKCKSHIQYDLRIFFFFQVNQPVTQTFVAADAAATTVTLIVGTLRNGVAYTLTVRSATPCD
jgi:hypothetical protein